MIMEESCLQTEQRPARGDAPLKVIGCSSLRGGGGELGTVKILTYGSNYFCTKHKLDNVTRCATMLRLVSNPHPKKVLQPITNPSKELHQESKSTKIAIRNAET